jgi:transposase
MTDIKRIAIDTSKSVFTLHAVDAADRTVLRRNLRRRELLGFFTERAPVEVALAACGGSHHWGRALTALGHRVRLIPPQYVKPFVKRSKNDRNDAEAISVAAAQPSIASVPVKSAEQQAAAMLLSVRELLVRQRTQLVNAMRGHAAEMGIVAALGEKGLAELRSAIAAADDSVVPAAAKQAIALLGREVWRIETRLKAIDAALMQQHKSNPVSRRLAAIPGIGPIAALSLTLRVDAQQFKSARHFAAWLGLVPRERSTGGRQRLGGISRAGDERLRQLLVLVPPRSSGMPSRAGRPLRHGCSRCSAVNRVNWRRSRWPIKTPASCGR